MVQYDVFEAGFNNLEETINFGKRAIGDSESLYEICTLAVIRSSDRLSLQGTKELQLTSFYEIDGRIFLGINNSLRIIKNTNQPDLIASFEFDYCLDNIAVSPCGRFIIICCQNGEILIKDVSSTLGKADDEESVDESHVAYECPSVFKENIECALDETQKCFIGSFADDSSSTHVTFYVVTCRGLIKRISLQCDENGSNQFTSEVVSDLKQSVRICALAYPFLCLEGLQLLVLDLRSNDREIVDCIGLKTLNAIGQNFFAFDKEGNIFKIDSARCLIFALNKEFPNLVNAYDSSLVLADGEKKFFAGITKNERRIQFLSLSESSMLYDIPLAYPTHIIDMKGVTEEVLFLVEVHKNDKLSEIRLQYVTETDPEMRVRRLVQRGLIEKAELFAQNFKVRPEFLAKAKAEYIIQKLECTPKETDELLKTLESIEDHSFRMMCCETVVCTAASDTRRVLCHGAFMEIDVRDCSENKYNPVLFKKRQFTRMLYRFDTYMQVYKKYDPKQWESFVVCDLIQEVKMLLRRGKVEEAALIYSRLEQNEIASLSDEKIEEVTFLLNQSWPLGSAFINTFIPLTLKYKPSALIIFVEWVHDRVYQLEKEDDQDFPDCAIKFLEDVTGFLNVYIPAQSHLGNECRGVLSNLLKALKNIQMLVNNFFIKLPLSEYLSAPHDIVRTLLSVELDSKHLELLMKEFLYPFMLKCGEDIDTLLIEEIKRLFIYDEEYWLNIAYILLKFVSKIDKKLEAIRDILEVAVIPWNEKVRDIARMTFEHSSTSPVAQEIVELLRDENILIILQRYNISKTQFKSLDEKIFYYHRIIFLNGNDYDKAIEDIHQLCRDDEDRFRANLLMIKEFIRRGSPETAIKLIDSFESQKICKLGMELFEDILFMGEQSIVPDKYRKAYHSAINPLWNRLHRHSTGKDRDDISHIYKVTRAVYELNNNFGVRVNRLMIENVKNSDVLNVLFQKVADLMLADGLFSFEKLAHYCKKIASCFGETPESILLKYMQFENNFSLFLRIGKYLLEESQCSELLMLCAIYLFKYSKINFSDAGDETFLDVAVAVNTSNSDDDLEAVHLARKLCVNALIFATEEVEMPTLEVLRWIDSCYYSTNLEEFHHYADIHQIYVPNSRDYYLGMSFESIKKMFNIFCAFSSPLGIDDHRYLTYFKPKQTVTMSEFKEEVRQFMWNMNALLKQNQHLTVFSMIKVMQRSCLCHPEIQDNILKPLQQFMLTTVLPDSIEAVLSYKYIDKTLLLSLMQLFAKDNYDEYVSKYLKLYKKQPNKLNVITQVGLHLLYHHGVQRGKSDLLNILSMCKWWFRINDPKMKYESYFTSKPEARLETLIKEEKITLENLPEYCVDFNLDLQSCYLKYMNTILLNWRPEVEYITEVSGKKNIVIKNSESELLAKCLKILERISCKKEVFRLTEQIWPLVNFYHYEVYLVLFLIHMRVSSPGTIPAAYRPLLCFLKTYRRVSSPPRLEIEQWYGTFPFKAVIDPLSEFRLPLTSSFLSNNIWDIIKQEINLDTYKDWFKVAAILKEHLNQQDICTYAINSPLSSGFINSACNTWDLGIKYDHLLPKVDECAQNISNLERATAAVYTLMCGMPPGADKVQMAELSYKYAQRYRESENNDEVEKVYVKVKRRYLNYSAIHILHKYQLAEDKYFEQVTQPSDLIWDLYNDPRIETYFDNLIFDCSDINKAVEELCILFGLSIKRECFNVLLKLLESNSPLDLDCRQLHRGTEGAHLKRACYLCKSQDAKNWQKFLIEQGMKPEQDMSFKANALRCFYYITDSNTVEEMSKMSNEQFVTHIDKVSVIAKMNDLGVKFETVAELDQQNQKRILKKLSKFNKPLALKCIASLCKIYAMDDLKYWEYIITTAIQFHMRKELRDYLEFLKDRCVTDCIKNAWQVILSDSFSNLGSSNLLESEIFLLLQSCPVIYEVDLEPYIQKCELCERRDVADVLRQFRRRLD